VTTDKCYQEQAWPWPYREADTLGGHDPYAASKACAELVTASYRDAFRWAERGLGVATVRAGNVIGGGDWTPERLVPDLLQAISQGQAAPIRNPSAVRPWQHVLEPLAGYLMLAERLLADPAHFSGAWNFGPETTQDHPVSDVLARLEALARGNGAPVLPTDFMPSSTAEPHEAPYLRIDASKARQQLGWIGRLDLDAALRLTWQWHSAWLEGRDMKACTLDQITGYLSTGRQTKDKTETQ
jgi:CDP-glucose 4,6-dehydratase